MGVIDAARKRARRIPQDIALVCFDGLPNVSHIFPFLTVAVQPAYDMGMNATLSLEPALEFNERSDVASSTRRKAIDRWGPRIPPGDFEEQYQLWRIQR